MQTTTEVVYRSELPAWESDPENKTPTGKQSKSKTTDYYRRKKAEFKVEHEKKKADYLASESRQIVNDSHLETANIVVQRIKAKKSAKDWLAGKKEVTFLHELEGCPSKVASMFWERTLSVT